MNAFGANVYSFVNTIPGSSLPPTMMMSSPSRLTAAAWNFVSGRVLLPTVSHELVILSSFSPIARRFPPCSVAVEKKSGQFYDVSTWVTKWRLHCWILNDC